MATVSWKGGAKATAQVQTYTFGGTWEADDLVRIQIGSKIVDVTAGSTTTATVVDNVITALGALDDDDYPEFAEVTPTRSTNNLVLTAATAGVPFSCTITPLEANGGAADAQTIEGAGTATTGTATTASAGPNDWGTAANWSGSAVPSSTDSVYFENSADDVLYGLAQSGVTLTLLSIESSFTGTIGLPIVNQTAGSYPEYRARHLAISATTLNVGGGQGQGSGRLLVNVGSNACTLNVYETASPLDEDLAALQWKGTHASNVVNVYKGSVDVARFAGETAVIATLRVGYDTSRSSDAEVYCSNGVTLTTVSQTGGNLTIESAATTITCTGGSLEVFGSGAITTINNHAGTIYHAGTGTVTTYVSGTGTLDHSRAMGTKTITNCTLNAGSALRDPGAIVTFTNGIVLNRCSLADVEIDLGFNRTLVPS